MAVTLSSNGGGRLSYPAVNFKQPLTGASGGLWLGFWIRLPPAGMAGNGPYALVARDSNADGLFTSGNELAWSIGGDSTGQGTARMRPQFRANFGGAQTAAPFVWSALSAQLPRETPLLMLIMVVNTGTTGSPVWKTAMAVCQANGAPESVVMSPDPVAGFISGTGQYLGQLFNNLGSATFQSPAGLAFEHVALGWGNFPWDAANGRPDHSVIAKLATGEYLWDASAVLNGGTLRDWRKLKTVSDLGDYSSQANAALTAAGTVVDASAVAPGLWQGASVITVNERPSGFVFGGLGTRTQSFTGTYSGSVTQLQRRIERNAGTLAAPNWQVVSGWDWADAGGSIGSGVWSFSLSGTGMPIGDNYRLVLRDKVLTDVQAVTANRWHVGFVPWLDGQSQIQRAEQQGRGIRAPVAGMVASVMRMAGGGRDAGASIGGAYVQPTVEVVPIQAASDTGGGMMALLEGWWTATGVPIMVIDGSIEGSGLAQWNTNAAYGNFFYRGDGVSLPTAGGANNSGVMTMLAIAAERYRDADLFNWGTSDTADTAGWTGKMATYRAFKDSYLSASPANAPMYLMPYPRSCGGSTWPAPLVLRDLQRSYAKTTARTVYIGDLLDIIMDTDGSNHPRSLIADSGSFTREIAGEGSQRQGLQMGRGLAWGVYGNSVDYWGPLLNAANFVDDSLTMIDVELGIAGGTKNGAALAPLFAVSADSGATWTESGFTVTLIGTKARYTKTSGSWPMGSTRVDYCRQMPFQSTRENTEAQAYSLIDGLVYGAGTWRDGRGQHLMPLGGSGLAVANPPVAAQGAGASVSVTAGTAAVTSLAIAVAAGASVALLGGTGVAGGTALAQGAGAAVAVLGGIGQASAAGAVDGVGARIALLAGSGLVLGDAAAVGAGALVSLAAGFGAVTQILPPSARADRVLDLSAADGRAFWVGGVPGAAWYRMARGYPWTIDLDADGSRLLEVRWAGLVQEPVNVTADVTNGEGEVTISDIVASASKVVFRATGAGAHVSLRVQHGPGQVDAEVIPLRIRMTTDVV